MTRSKISALAAVVIIAIFSIYADTVTTFTSQNNTQQPIPVTLQLQSGSQVSLMLQPGQTVPTNLNGGDQVVSETIFNSQVVAGQNTVIPSPFGGTLTIYWTVVKNQDGSSSCVANVIDATMVG